MRHCIGALIQCNDLFPFQRAHIQYVARNMQIGACITMYGYEWNLEPGSGSAWSRYVQDTNELMNHTIALGSPHGLLPCRLLCSPAGPEILGNNPLDIRPSIIV